MARIRTIKPDFWTDEKVVELSPLARLLFIGMWNFVDDYGRGEFSPRSLKMKILPADDADVLALLGEICRQCLIVVYDVDGKSFFQVSGFVKHQKVDKRSPSRIPPPPNSPELPRSVQTDKEGKGREVISSPLRSEDISPPSVGLSDLPDPTDGQTDDFLISKLVDAIGEKAAPGLLTSEGIGPIREALSAGADLELDILPLVRDVAQNLTRPWRRFSVKLGFGVNAILARSRNRSKRAEATPPRVFIEFNSPQWRSWQDFHRERSSTMPSPVRSSVNRTNGYWFVSEFPPSAEAAE